MKIIYPVYSDWFSLPMSYDNMTLQVNGRGVGFVSITTQVDLNLLNNCFDLTPYHGLHKPSDEDEAISVEGISELPL